MALPKTLWQTIVDLVSTGQNVSDQLDTAFGNIDNAIDQIDTNTADIAVLEAPEETRYTPITEAEAGALGYVAGRTYFSSDYNTMQIESDIEGITTEVGHNMHTNVVNNSGATIPKGSAVRTDGTDNGVTQIVLAQANSFDNAIVLGITIIDMPNGTSGAVTTAGVLRNQNTNGATTGVPQYLSATVAGGFTHIRPAIVTILGSIQVADATAGRGIIKIQNNQVLPLMLGSLLEATAPASLPSDLINGTPLTLYSSNIEIVTTANMTTGTIAPLLDGTYRLNVSLHSFFDNVGGAGKKEIYLDLIDVTASTTVKSIRGFILKDAETYSITNNGAVVLTGGHEYRLELRSELALTNFAFSSSTFYIESIIY